MNLQALGENNRIKRIIITTNNEFTIKRGFVSISFNAPMILVLVSGFHPSYLTFKIIDGGQVVNVAGF